MTDNSIKLKTEANITTNSNNSDMMSSLSLTSHFHKSMYTVSQTWLSWTQSDCETLNFHTCAIHDKVGQTNYKGILVGPKYEASTNQDGSHILQCAQVYTFIFQSQNNFNKGDSTFQQPEHTGETTGHYIIFTQLKLLTIKIIPGIIEDASFVSTRANEFCGGGYQWWNIDTGMYIHAHKCDESKHLPAFCDHCVIRMQLMIIIIVKALSCPCELLW